MPHQQRRELFEAFAHRIIVDKAGEIKRRLVVEWRDGTTSETVFRSGKTQYTMSKAERQKMVQMIHDQRPQWEILREFPGLNWSGIVTRFFREGRITGKHGRIAEVYKQPRKYTYQQTWYDTEECQQSLSIPASSSVLPTTQGIIDAALSLRSFHAHQTEVLDTQNRQSQILPARPVQVAHSDTARSPFGQHLCHLHGM